MPLLQRKRVVLAKIESTYGTDAAPTGPLNAILVRSLDVSPLDADLVSRDMVRPYYGNYDQLIAGQKVTVTMEVELQSSGTAGTAPAWGPLLRACGMSETLNGAAVTGSATGGGANTITLAAGASSTDGAYNGMPIRITSGTGSGSSGTIIAYNGTTKVATVAANWATAPANLSGYSIDQSAVYKPISSGFESVSIYAQPQDSVSGNSPLHKITGCRGNFEINMTAKQIPVIKFTFTGLYNAVTDVANVVPTYTAFKQPLPVNKQNTPSFSFFGYNAVANELTLNANNEVVYRNLIGSETVLLTDRKLSGQAVIEAPTITAKDFFTAALGSSYGTALITHGSTSGAIVDVIAGNSVDLTTPTYSDMDGIVMMTLPFVLIPSTAGNDELFITLR